MELAFKKKERLGNDDRFDSFFENFYGALVSKNSLKTSAEKIKRTAVTFWLMAEVLNMSEIDGNLYRVGLVLRGL